MATTKDEAVTIAVVAHGGADEGLVAILPRDLNHRMAVVASFPPRMVVAMPAGTVIGLPVAIVPVVFPIVFVVPVMALGILMVIVPVALHMVTIVPVAVIMTMIAAMVPPMIAIGLTMMFLVMPVLLFVVSTVVRVLMAPAVLSVRFVMTPVTVIAMAAVTMVVGQCRAGKSGDGKTKTQRSAQFDQSMSTHGALLSQRVDRHCQSWERPHA